MERILKMTGDGSHTLFVKGLEESFHSVHGACQESMHVFINQGLLTLNKTAIRILELGFGTGLNAVLSLRAANEHKLDIYYHSIEKYPLIESEYSMLNYEKMIDGLPAGSLNQMHSCPWEKPVRISKRFTLYKEKADFRTMKPPADINLVYFDAFSPDKQPELWSSEVFALIADSVVQGAVLVTYSAKGVVRRTMNSFGFEVIKVKGPPGKREMIRAIKR